MKKIALSGRVDKWCVFFGLMSIAFFILALVALVSISEKPSPTYFVRCIGNAGQVTCLVATPEITQDAPRLSPNKQPDMQPL